MRENETDARFEGHYPRECGEHRTLGQRAWCFECSEYCSPHAPCTRCELPGLRAAEAERDGLRELVDDWSVRCHAWEAKAEDAEVEADRLQTEVHRRVQRENALRGELHQSTTERNRLRDVITRYQQTYAEADAAIEDDEVEKRSPKQRSSGGWP